MVNNNANRLDNTPQEEKCTKLHGKRPNTVLGLTYLKKNFFLINYLKETQIKLFHNISVIACNILALMDTVIFT